ALFLEFRFFYVFVHIKADLQAASVNHFRCNNLTYLIYLPDNDCRAKITLIDRFLVNKDRLRPVFLKQTILSPTSLTSMLVPLNRLAQFRLPNCRMVGLPSSMFSRALPRSSMMLSGSVLGAKYAPIMFTILVDIVNVFSLDISVSSMQKVSEKKYSVSVSRDALLSDGAAEVLMVVPLGSNSSTSPTDVASCSAIF
ncbi:hypothetical protein L9F63_016455, partial [Diploptera punctata]